MQLRLEKDLPVLLFALVSVSMLASLPQVESAWLGVKEVYGEQDFGLRILRELMLAVLIAYVFFEPRLRGGVLSTPVLAFFGVIATYVLFEVGYALHLDLPLVVPMAGLRVFEYLPVALIGYVTSRLGKGATVTYQFAHYPNLFGATMATCALLFSLVPSMRKWLVISVFLALLSGSRTAFISALLVVYFQLVAVLRPRDRWAVVMPAPIFAVAALLLASSPLLSGRDDANPTEDGRIDLWQRVFSEQMHGPADLLFGWGLGLSSNTINILYGAEHFKGQFDSDSLYLFLLNGYGLVGLLAYVFFLWTTIRRSGHTNKGLVVAFIIVAGLTFNLWEYFPQNAMLMFLWGTVLGTEKASSSSPLQANPSASGLYSRRPS